jgi:hypothetical protein
LVEYLLTDRMADNLLIDQLTDWLTEWGSHVAIVDWTRVWGYLLTNRPRN